MKERPYYFPPPSADAMVRAVFAGTKTQMRVPVPIPLPTPWRPPPLDWLHAEPPKQSYGFWFNDRMACVSPFGGPGDRLWVQECWQPQGPWKGDLKSGTVWVMYRADGTRLAMRSPPECLPVRVDCPEKWRPSIHMPRWASRITLEVTRVWLKRVQDITEEDAKAEGPPEWVAADLFGAGNRMRPAGTRQYRTCFEYLWDSIYAAKGYAFDDNPWVWVCEFERKPR